MLSATTENATRLLTSQTTERRPLQRTGLPNLLIIQSKFFFLFIGREATTRPANNSLLMCNVVQLCLAANNILLMRIKMKLHFSPSCDCPCMKVTEHFTSRGYSLKTNSVIQ